MKAVPTRIPEVFVIESAVFGDDRGAFSNIYLSNVFNDTLNIPLDFVQESYSRSKCATIRGMHFQNPNTQGKLATVMWGAIWDVALDIRRESPTFGQWVGVELRAGDGRSLYIPPGFAHGFQAISNEDAVVHYKLSAYWSPESEGIVRWDDPELNIPWPITNPHLSVRDAEAPCLADVTNLPNH